LRKQFVVLTTLVAAILITVLGCKTPQTDDPVDTTAPAEVINLTATAGNGQATINWLPPGDSDYAGVKITATGISEIAVTKDTISKVITGLTNGTEYAFTIKTVDTTGNVSKGTTVKVTPSAPVTPTDTTAPAEVTSLTATAGNGTVTLNWIDPSDADFASVEISLNGVVSASVAKGTQVKAITSLTNGTEYTFIIKTVDTNSNVSAGKTIKATPTATADTTPPSNVTGLTATAGDGQVVLAWAEPSESDFAKVSISGIGFTTVEVLKGTTSKTITGLTNSTLYTFTIKSIDTTGNISSGASKDATPIAGTPTTYTVTFHSNGGSTVSTITGVTTRSTITQPGNPTQTGYTFVAWYKESGLTNAWNFGSDTVTSDVNLYAKWSINSYTITFVYDNGAGNTTQTANYNTALASLPSPTKLGHSFGGWWTESGGTGNTFTTSSLITGNITVYAKWAVNNYNVVFNGNTSDGGSTATQSITFGTSSNLTVNGFTKTGYNFSGWATSSGGSVAYANNASYTMNTEGATLYAVWVAKSSNADLASLSLTSATLSPDFSASTTSYTSSVANSVSNITINATVADGKASLTGTGSVSLSEGSNTFNVKVTAENGTTKTYTIVITRASAAIAGIYKYYNSAWNSMLNTTPPGIIINYYMDGATYYVGTTSGLYKWSGSAWDQKISVIPSETIINYTIYSGTYYVGTTSGVYKWDGTSTWLSEINITPPGTIINYITPTVSTHYVGTTSGLYKWSGSAWDQKVSVIPSGTTINYLINSTTYYVGTTSGVYKWDGTSTWLSEINIAPPGTIINYMNNANNIFVSTK